jgi:hypothetical protein
MWTYDLCEFFKSSEGTYYDFYRCILYSDHNRCVFHPKLSFMMFINYRCRFCFQSYRFRFCFREKNENVNGFSIYQPFPTVFTSSYSDIFCYESN